MDEVQMLGDVKKSLLAVTCVLDSMKEDFAVIQKSMDNVIKITNGWKVLLRGSVEES